MCNQDYEQSNEPRVQPESVSVDAVAALVMKIGVEIWGKEKFENMMTKFHLPKATGSTTIPSGQSSPHTRQFRNMKGKEPA